MERCQFCDVLTGRADGPPSAYEDDDFAVLMGRRQPTGPGYALVVPRRHIADLHELPDHLLAPTLRLVRRVSLAVRAEFGATGTTITENNGRPGQSIAHLHFHVVPRKPDDGYPSEAAEAQPPAELRDQAARLRKALL